MGAYIAIVAIVAWALVSMQSIRSKAGGPETEKAIARLTDALASAEAERKRLTERVENLEAIVTTETYDLARHDPAKAAARLKVPDEEESPEEHAARLARRMRT